MPPKPSRRLLRRDSADNDDEPQAFAQIDTTSSLAGSPNMEMNTAEAQTASQAQLRGIMTASFINADLSTATADRIKSDDMAPMAHPSDLRRILNTRKVNDPDSTEYQEFMKHKEEVSAWSNFVNTPDAVHGEEDLNPILGGQSHRQGLQLRLERERMRYAAEFIPEDGHGHGGHEGHAARGGRAGRGGRGGGNLGTRGRGAPYRGSSTAMSNLPAGPSMSSTYKPLDPAVERNDYSYSGGKKKGPYRGTSSVGHGGGAVSRNPGHPTAQRIQTQITNGAERVASEVERKTMPSSNYAFASKMLEKMGHIPGQGLGASGQGMVEPIQVRVLKPRAGLGIPISLSKSKRAKKKRKSKPKAKKRNASPSGSLYCANAHTTAINPLDDPEGFMAVVDKIRTNDNSLTILPKTSVGPSHHTQPVLSSAAQISTAPTENLKVLSTVAASPFLKAEDVQIRTVLTSDIKFPPPHRGDTLSWTDGQPTPKSGDFETFQTSPELDTQSTLLGTDGNAADSKAAPFAAAPSSVGLGISDVPHASTTRLIEADTTVSEDCHHNANNVEKAEKPIDLMDTDNDTICQPSITPSLSDGSGVMVRNGIRYLREDIVKQSEGAFASLGEKPQVTEKSLANNNSAIDTKFSNQRSILGNHNLSGHDNTIDKGKSQAASTWSIKPAHQMKSHFNDVPPSLTPKPSLPTMTAQSSIIGEASYTQGRKNNSASSLQSSRHAETTASVKLGDLTSLTFNSLTLGASQRSPTAFQANEGQRKMARPANPFGEFTAFVVRPGTGSVSSTSTNFDRKSHNVDVSLTSPKALDNVKNFGAAPDKVTQYDSDLMSLTKSDGKPASANLAGSRWGIPDAAVVTSLGRQTLGRRTLKQVSPHIASNIANPFATMRDENLPTSADVVMIEAIAGLASDNRSSHVGLSGNDLKAATMVKRATTVEETQDQKLTRLMSVSGAKEFMTPFQGAASEEDSRSQSPLPAMSSVRSESQTSSAKPRTNIVASKWATVGRAVTTRASSPPRKEVSTVTAKNAHVRSRLSLVDYGSDDSDL